jgi:hypothetical protein
MKKIVLLMALMVGSAYAQAEQPVCISQEAANKCADNVNVVAQQKAEIEALRTALGNRDKIIEDLKSRVAVESQRVVDSQAENLRLIALMEALLKSYTKPKKWGIIVF